jgi:hypothetical protein
MTSAASRTSRRLRGAAALTATLAMATPGLAASYLEIFPTPPPPAGVATTDEAQLEAQGWFGGHSGDPFGSNPVSGEGALGGGTNVSDVETPVNSNPQGAFPPSQFAFFSKTTTSNAFLYTNEYSFPSAPFTMRFDTRNNATTQSGLIPGGEWYDQGSEAGADYHLAFRVDDGTSSFWYVSTEGFLHGLDSSTWEKNVAQATADLDFWLFGDGPDDGATLPGPGTAGAPGLTSLFSDLPAGTVDAFGFYMARSAGTLRVDNVEIEGHGPSEIPLPGSLPLMAVALGGIGLAARRRARRAQGAG